ncbi:glycosyltransferase family 4 protein [Alkalibacterium olivapovliticus]|uniref:Glycosyltransferase involved in cell wall biosynthesis n=1 Tax=Alkalibacterium olivapovliticus TaxID=99907 RepID=A0A2T0W9S8_9LACT|nr:glycosyltransferase family 4 protein [Alkalibacterium olivapovliticus]PRY83475.1 hypothetical protein CLV38_10481 [Alkalibacterium olivapovliticus]
MKVAHINAGNEFGGGLVHIISLLTALQETGTEAELIVLEEGPVAKAAREKGLSVTVFEQSSRYDLSVLKQVKAYIQSNQFDLVHTHGPRANMLVNLLRPFLKVKWVVTVHSNPLLDFENQGLKGRLFEKINTKSLIKADGVIAVSNEIKMIVCELGGRASQIATIHNGITFSEPLSSVSHEEIFTIIAVGRLHRIKQFDLLLDALTEMGTTNWQLMLCGEGEEEGRLRRLAEELHCSPHIHFEGWLPAERLKEVIAQADIMVHPSKSESFPLVLLEAAEQEVPVIATDVGDVRELITDYELGWLIESADKQELVRALNEAYSEWIEGKLPIKGKQLREHALAYSLTAQAEKVTSFYNRIRY